MTNTELFAFRLLVARTMAERDLVLLLSHADTLTADQRKTPLERDRANQAVEYVRDRIAAFQTMKSQRGLQFPVDLYWNAA